MSSTLPKPFCADRTHCRMTNDRFDDSNQKPEGGSGQISSSDDDRRARERESAAAEDQQPPRGAARMDRSTDRARGRGGVEEEERERHTVRQRWQESGSNPRCYEPTPNVIPKSPENAPRPNGARQQVAAGGRR
ncbi:hypothetical protein Mapa_001936 [Marchantia paleacea]|nr:hypothetical protein Mapa_001936 [Marchantia paleacea]